MRIIELPDGKVWVIKEIEVPRGIRSKDKTKENEVIIYGFNKNLYPDLLEKFKKELK